jgi:hypothetical protein
MGSRLHLKNKVKVKASARLVIVAASITFIAIVSFLIYNLFIDTEDTLASSDENRMADFSYRIPLLMDKSFIRGAEVFEEFSVAVVLEHEDFKSIHNGGKIVNSIEPDIAFTKKDGTTMLPYLIENYDPVKGKLTAWLNIDSLSSNVSDSMYVYYSSTVSRKISKHAGTPQDMIARWHFNKDANAYMSQVQFAKLTGSKNVYGKLGGAKLFEGKNGDMAAYNFHKNLMTEESFTMSLWVKAMEKGKNQVILSTFDDMGGGYYLALNEKLQPEFVFNASNDKRISSLQSKTEQLETDKWHHIAVVVNTKSMLLSIFIDGIPEKDILIPASMKASALGMMLGKRHFDENSTINAAIDELQIYNTAKSSSWIATTYFNQAKAAELFSLGFPESFKVTDVRIQDKSKSAQAGSEEANAEHLLKQYKMNEQMLDRKAQQLKAKSSNPEDIQARLDNIKRIANSKGEQN